MSIEDNELTVESLRLMGTLDFKVLSLLTEIAKIEWIDLAKFYAQHVEIQKIRTEKMGDYEGLTRLLADYVKDTGEEVVGVVWDNGKIMYLGKKILDMSRDRFLAIDPLSKVLLLKHTEIDTFRDNNSSDVYVIWSLDTQEIQILN